MRRFGLAFCAVVVVMCRSRCFLRAGDESSSDGRPLEFRAPPGSSTEYFHVSRQTRQNTEQRYAHRVCFWPSSGNHTSGRKSLRASPPRRSRHRCRRSSSDSPRVKSGTQMRLRACSYMPTQARRSCARGVSPENPEPTPFNRKRGRSPCRTLSPMTRSVALGLPTIAFIGAVIACGTPGATFTKLREPRERAVRLGSPTATTMAAVRAAAVPASSPRAPQARRQPPGKPV